LVIYGNLSTPNAQKCIMWLQQIPGWSKISFCVHYMYFDILKCGIIYTNIGGQINTLCFAVSRHETTMDVKNNLNMMLCGFQHPFGSVFCKRIIFVVAVFAVAYLFPEFLNTFLIAPFFILECECACGGSSSSCTGGELSTPFLYLKTSSGYKLENDILFGKPQSLFLSLEEGKRAYEDKTITPDLYKLKNKPEISPEGVLKLRIKEIEPEESFFDHLALTRVVHPADTEVVVDSEFKSYWLLEKEKVINKASVFSDVVATFKDRDITKDIMSSNDGQLNDTFFDEGEYLTCFASVDESKLSKNEYMLLVMQSYYRDWTVAPVVYGTAGQAKRSEHRNLAMLTRKIARIVPVSVVAVLLSFSGAFSNLINNNDKDASFQDLFSTTKARADTPHNGGSCGSFIVEYWDGKMFQGVEVVSPRYAKCSPEAVRIPRGAIKNGAIQMKITATKRHAISFLNLTISNNLKPIQEDKIEVSKAYHRREEVDYTRALNSPFSGKYLHTAPSDIVDVEFNIPHAVINSGEQVSFLIHAGGFYVPLRKETGYILGDWVNKLDDESKEILHHLNAIKGYDTDERVSVLTS